MAAVVVSFETETARTRVRRLLEAGGIEVRGVFQSGADTVRALRRLGGGVAVCGCKLRDATCDELCEDLEGIARVVAVATAERLDLCRAPALIRVSVPLDREALCAAVMGAMPAAPARSEEAREAIGRAKSRLMAAWGMSEEAAHRYLQRQSMLRRLPMHQTALTILKEEEL